MRLITMVYAPMLISLHTGLQAQEPTLKPVSSYVSAIRDGDVSAMRYVARRCSALYIVAANQLEEVGQRAAAEGFHQPAGVLFEVAVRTNAKLGATTEESLRDTQIGIEDIGRVLIERMRHNMAVTGSYFAEDPLLASDFITCKEVAESVSKAGVE